MSLEAPERHRMQAAIDANCIPETEEQELFDSCVAALNQIRRKKQSNSLLIKTLKFLIAVLAYKIR
jgi:hypothetical protein